VKAEIYIYYFKAMGIGLALLGVLFYALFQTFTVGANLWLSIWSEDEEAATNIPKRNLYLGVYGALGLLQVCVMGYIFFEVLFNYTYCLRGTGLFNS